MVDDKPEDVGLQADRPKRAGPTLDLDAIEISDETLNADAGNADEKPSRTWSWPAAAVMSSAVVSAIVGAGAAGLVVWVMRGEPAPPPPAPAPPQVTKATVDALTVRVAGIESKAAAPVVAAPAAPATPDPALTAQLDAVEKSVATLRDELAAANARSQQLAASIEAVKSAPREPAPPPPDLSAINERLAQIERAAKTLSSETAQRNAEPADDVPLRRVVAASLLDVSVRAGEPYAAALSAAKPLAGNAETLKPLDIFASSGVPSTNGLNRELLALLPKLSPAQDNSTTGSGIVDRLQAGAARLVRIERTDAVAGNDRSAIVARVTAAALRNDIGEARRELKTLAPADRAAAQSWIDKSDARDAALAASRQFAADAMAALGKPAQ
jgi:hypothetical protein